MDFQVDLADFDQKHAAILFSISTLIEAFEQLKVESKSKEFAIFAQASWLFENFEKDALSEHLSVAIQKLSELKSDDPIV